LAKEDAGIERLRQDKKWGEQNHPDVDPVLTGRKGGCDAQRMAEEYEMPTANRAKFMCQIAAHRKQCTWAHIALEELAEAVAAATDEGEIALRAEVIQLAAVCVQWAEAIDRRAERRAAELLR
jgi:hypothetical protein